MIAICVREDGITVSGHAGYAEQGNDIICAAVSALAQNLIKSIEDLTDDVIVYDIAPGNINIRYKNLSEQGKLLVDSFFIGICGIQEAYGSKYVAVQ